MGKKDIKRVFIISSPTSGARTTTSHQRGHSLTPPRYSDFHIEENENFISGVSKINWEEDKKKGYVKFLREIGKANIPG